MRTRNVLPAALGLVVFVAMIAPGCGSDANTEDTSTGSGRPAESTSSASTGGQGGAGQGGAGQGGAGQGGAGGQGGGVTATYGPPATDIVSAGEVSKSLNYSMVFTLGQSTQNQGTTTSPSYRLQGGLVGANGSLP